MAGMHYQQQNYPVFGQSEWHEDVKATFVDDDDHHSVDDRPLEQPNLPSMNAVPHSRRQSFVKVEEDFNAPQAWPERPQPPMAQMRHYSHPAIPTIHTLPHQTSRIHEQTYLPSYGPSHVWPVSAHSESSTPTQMFGPVQESIPVQYAQPSHPYSYQPQELLSAVPMSPQSSQGGWASTTSSDSADQKASSPRYRHMSPMTVVRSDGIRKKNARFEIPKERNLSTIDMLIQKSTDEKEKKELKQQKRLLRNRQAALDSRQRKKIHTEKLESEKKELNKQQAEMEETIRQLEATVTQEREQWFQERQYLEQNIQHLRHNLDEVIAAKTNETADLRRRNNLLESMVRDLERKQANVAFASTNSTSENFHADFTNFSNLDLGDNWDNDFDLIENDDLELEGDDSDTPQRQLTPRPPPAPTSATSSSSSSSTISKQDLSFGSGTLVLCALFGALFLSQSNANASADASAASSTVSSASISTAPIPAHVPAEYRADAGNVLKYVLASNPDPTHDLIPSRSAGASLPTTISGTEFSHISNQNDLSSPAASSLDRLSSALTTPSRQQLAVSAFSLSTESYNHIANADSDFDDPTDERSRTPKPSKLQRMFTAMQRERNEMDEMSGLTGDAGKRSVLLDRVPEGVLRDFRRLVEERAGEGRG